MQPAPPRKSLLLVMNLLGADAKMLRAADLYLFSSQTICEKRLKRLRARVKSCGFLLLPEVLLLTRCLPRIEIFSSPQRLLSV
jgi:hypothetical protein